MQRIIWQMFPKTPPHHAVVFLDADYAAETTELARTQIIQQAGTAMLSQANQQAQSVLALLK